MEIYQGINQIIESEMKQPNIAFAFIEFSNNSNMHDWLISNVSQCIYDYQQESKRRWETNMSKYVYRNC